MQAVPGGEAAFISRMVQESTPSPLLPRLTPNLTTSLWYTSMVGKHTTLEAITRELKAAGCPIVRLRELFQGRTARWVVAWSWTPEARVLADGWGIVPALAAASAVREEGAALPAVQPASATATEGGGHAALSSTVEVGASASASSDDSVAPPLPFAKRFRRPAQHCLSAPSPVLPPAADYSRHNDSDQFVAGSSDGSTTYVTPPWTAIPLQADAIRNVVAFTMNIEQQPSLPCPPTQTYPPILLQVGSNTFTVAPSAADAAAIWRLVEGTHDGGGGGGGSGSGGSAATVIATPSVVDLATLASRIGAALSELSPVKSDPGLSVVFWKVADLLAPLSPPCFTPASGTSIASSAAASQPMDTSCVAAWRGVGRLLQPPPTSDDTAAAPSSLSARATGENDLPGIDSDNGCGSSSSAGAPSFTFEVQVLATTPPPPSLPSLVSASSQAGAVCVCIAMSLLTVTGGEGRAAFQRLAARLQRDVQRTGRSWRRRAQHGLGAGVSSIGAAGVGMG